MKKGKTSMLFENVYFIDGYTVAGKTEKDGPIGQYFDKTISDYYYGTKSFEKCEQKMMTEAIEGVISRNPKTVPEFLIAGDLIDHNGISNYVAKKFDIPLLGIYSACASSVYSIIISANFIEAGNAETIVCAVSSHNCTSERVFRYPVEYGFPKSDCATFTVTGGAASLISSKKSMIKVARATVGKVIDPKTMNPNDLGRSMAPAALDTFFCHMEDFNLKDDYYDLVVTGDLSEIGSEVFKLGLKQENRKLREYNDCGLIVYDTKTQDVKRGGSGCGCCGIVTFSYLIKKMLEQKYKKILVIATGALLNKGMTNQKETIPSVAHAIALEVES